MIDAALMEVFRAELDAHAETLTAELLALEKGGVGRTEAMMRAAHSIKGAARIVGIEPIVGLSHVMEDYFVGVQEGKFKPSRGAVDVMLRGVDLFQRASAMTADPPDDWSAALGDESSAVIAEIERQLRGESTEDKESLDGFSCRRDGTTLHVVLNGDLTGDRSETLRGRLAKERADGAREAVLNLGSVGDVDAAGVMLLQRLAEARNISPSFVARIENATQDLTLLLKSCGLNQLLTTTSSN